MVRVRVAPSPTGEDLHIGNVYTALVNWAFAKKNNGKFIVRIEDTDRDRLIEGAEAQILKSLKIFGLNYDEGPDIGGPFVPYRQSERKDIYQKYARQLVDKDAAYYCPCSKEKLEEIKKTQQQEKIFKKHIFYCTPSSTPPQSYVIRLKSPENEEIAFDDVIRGRITISSQEVDDQILIKSDGFPTYHLAVVVDDHLMEISHVIRAEEWISSMPKHVLLYRALGWQIPIHAHLPLLRNSDKSKLSKRDNPVWASWYLKQGFLPEAVLNYLCLMGWSHPDGKEIFSVDEYVQKLELKDFAPVGPVFDLVKLEWMNGEYIRDLKDEELTERLEKYLVDSPPKERLAKLVPLIKDRIKKLSDFVPLTSFIFDKPDYDLGEFRSSKLFESEEKIKEILGKIVEVLEGLAKPWQAEAFESSFRSMAAELELPAGDVFQVIRIAISGQRVTPPLFESIQVMGEDEALDRIKTLARSYPKLPDYYQDEKVETENK